MHGAQQFGGKLRVAASMLIELLFSMLLAPVRMLFHTLFVAAAFLGWAIRWKSPPREDSETSWGEAMRKHGLQMLLGLVWGGGVYWLNPSFLPWLLPITGSLLLSAPISVWSSRVSLGSRFRDAQLFMIPEEAEPPQELAATFGYARTARRLPDFIDAVVDPFVNALACAVARPRPLPPHTRAARIALGQKALQLGPGALSEQQRNMLLNDPLLLSQLHLDVWTSADAHTQWQQRIQAEPQLPKRRVKPALNETSVPSLMQHDSLIS
jgi:membrane glycosyltransferase